MPDDTFIRELTRCQTTLSGYCQAALGRSDDAEEAHQRANVVLWKKADSWDRSVDFEKWALGVARYEVLAVIRNRARDREKVTFDSDVVDLMSKTAAKVIKRQDKKLKALQQCLSELNEKQHTTLAAYYHQHKTIKVIAEEQGRGPSAIKMLLMRLRRSLSDCVTARLAGDIST